MRRICFKIKGARAPLLSSKPRNRRKDREHRSSVFYGSAPRRHQTADRVAFAESSEEWKVPLHLTPLPGGGPGEIYRLAQEKKGPAKGLLRVGHRARQDCRVLRHHRSLPESSGSGDRERQAARQSDSKAGGQVHGRVGCSRFKREQDRHRRRRRDPALEERW